MTEFWEGFTEFYSKIWTVLSDGSSWGLAFGLFICIIGIAAVFGIIQLLIEDK